MYKILQADKDSYITNRVIGNVGSGTLRVNANVGRAGTLDLFKLYGATFSSGNIPNVELTRALIHFDLQPLKDMIGAGKININDDSFNCRLHLFDVYGGQTTPSDFVMSVFPLSRSFSEGEGRDVVYYSDYDVCNFLSSSRDDGAWFISGANLGGGASEPCDYITGSSQVNDYEVTQRFVTGEEDLDVDVTTIVSSTLSGIIPDSGFRLSLQSIHDHDNYSYFVKRFSSRSAYNSSKRPRLIVKYNDSVQDDSQNLRFNSAGSVFLRNYEYDALTNIRSGSSQTVINGINCVFLRLEMMRSNGSGTYSLYFTGSQYSDGLNYYSGIYSASVYFDQYDPVIKYEIEKSGSIEFTPVWYSLDGTVDYYTGSTLRVYPSDRTNSAFNLQNYVVTVSGLQSLHRSTESVNVRLNVFDHTSPYIKLTKVPAVLPGIIVKNAYYQIRDISTNESVIPFDTTHDSTKASSDFSGMYFSIDMSNLPTDRSYTVDVMLRVGGQDYVYRSVSSPFNVSDNHTA